MNSEVKAWQAEMEVRARQNVAEAADVKALGFLDGTVLRLLREWIRQGASVKDFWTFLPILLDLIMTYGPMIAEIVKKIIDRIKNGTPTLAEIMAEVLTVEAA